MSSVRMVALVATVLLQLPFAYAAFRFMVNRAKLSDQTVTNDRGPGDFAWFAAELGMAALLVDAIVVRAVGRELVTWASVAVAICGLALMPLVMAAIDAARQKVFGGARRQLRCFVAGAFAGLFSVGIISGYIVTVYALEGQSPGSRRARPSRLGHPSAPHVGLASHLGYYVLRPVRGAVVSIRSEDASGVPEDWQQEVHPSLHFRKRRYAFYLGRVVGMPGETVTVDGGLLTVDGTPLHEPYVQNNLTRGTPLVIRLKETDYLLAEDIREGYESQPNAFFVAHERQFATRQLLILWPPRSIGFVQPPEYNVTTRGLITHLVSPRWLERWALM